MEYNNIEGHELRLLMCYHLGYQMSELHSWLSEWLIEDYDILYQDLEGAAFSLFIPVECIKSSKISDVLTDMSISCNSYPQTKRGSSFWIMKKLLNPPVGRSRKGFAT